jgi:predicted nucleotide-binding protein
MDKQEIIDNQTKEVILTTLDRLKTRLYRDVADAFESQGSQFGAQRLVAWRKAVSTFLEQYIPPEQLRFNGMFKKIAIFGSANKSDLEIFWINDGKGLLAYIESLILDIQNNEYDFTPFHTEVKQVTTSPDVEVKAKSNKVFIVHGHDGEVKYRTANFLRQHGLDPIILHLKASRNRTIIEKLEKYTEDVGYGIVLYTPDDLGQVKPKALNGELDNRARQNVIFEHGYLMGLIGRENVVAIVKGDIELPNDISGVVYIDDADWEKTLLIELRDAGYALDIANL